MDWVEELLHLRNLAYYNQRAKALVKEPRAPKQGRTTPDLSDNDFWDKGEVTK